MIGKRSLIRLDWLMISLLTIAGIWMVRSSVDLPVHPAEDAAMLMRYAQHLAQGHGIVWNIGQPPVDGATDFLFMLVLAGVYALGGGLETSVVWLCGLSHILTVLLVYYGVRRYFQGGFLAALISALFLLVGPGMRYAEASFGTPFFTLFCALSWLAAQYVQEKPDSYGRILGFSIICLMMGLTRPEGVLFAGFMFLAVFFKLGWNSSTKLIVIMFGVFLILGGFYFNWRWYYFGYPLPNPFYKKGGGSLYFDSLRESWTAILELSFPFWLIFAGGLIGTFWQGFHWLFFDHSWWNRLIIFFKNLLRKKSRSRIVSVIRVISLILLIAFSAGLVRKSSDLHGTLVLGRYSARYAGLLLALLIAGLTGVTAGLWLPVTSSKKVEKTPVEPFIHISRLVKMFIYTSIPVIGFIVMWVFLSNEMNYLWRFQYPVLPLILMSWPLMVEAFCQDVKPLFSASVISGLRGLPAILIVLLGAGLVWNQINRWQINYQVDGRFAVAEYLAQFAEKRYTIATSEAGLLPLYSGWQAVDTWGLNDSWIAHNGGITAEYLEKIAPEIIMFHADFSPIIPKQEAGDDWGRMVLTLDQYARDHGYILAAAYGDRPVDTHYYYVRPDFPDSREIVDFIRSLDGGGYHYGAHPLDYNKLMWIKD